MTRKNKGWSKKTEGQTVMKSEVSSFAVGTTFREAV